MATKYYAVLTNVGAAKLANATALGAQVEITQMAVGDGNGVLPTPNPAQTALVHELRRKPLNSLSIDPNNANQIIAEQVIPEDEGGWWIREIGLFDKDGDMIAVANCAETYKPQLQEGSGRVQVVRMILIVSSTAAVTLKIDPSVVLATRQYVDDQIIQVKSYVDQKMAAHVAAADPHKQYAPKESPALTGRPTAPTAEGKDSSTQIANTAFVQAAIAALVGSSPEALDTLNELAAALGNDPNFATTVTNSLAGKMDKSANGSDIENVSVFLQNLGISAPGGAGSVGYKLNAENTVSRTAYDNFSDRINAGDFGIKGDGIADNAAAITKACAALQKLYEIDGIRRTLVFTDGSYRTSDTIVVHANMLIHCEGGVVFQNIGAVKTFAAVELQGGSKKSVLGTMDGYGSAILIRGSTHTVEFQTISNCVDGVIFRADNNWASTKSSLDNVVRGVQIGKCTNAIVFEQNANNLVQQGNEVRVNFVSETPNTLLFRNFDGFVHTEESNWDSNFVELIASDPITLPDSSMARNSTPHSVSNLTMAVKSWCGGWVPDAGSMCLIRGAFSTSTFEFNLAQRVGLNEVVDAVGVNSFGSCILRNTRYENLGNSISYIGVTTGAEFNSGLALFRSKFRVRFTVVPLAAGQTYGLSFKHVLSQRSNTGRMRIVQYSDTARGKLLIEVRDAGTETQGLVRVWFTNLTQTTTSTMDVEIIFEAE